MQFVQTASVHTLLNLLCECDLEHVGIWISSLDQQLSHVIRKIYRRRKGPEHMHGRNGDHKQREPVGQGDYCPKQPFINPGTVQSEY